MIFNLRKNFNFLKKRKIHFLAESEYLVVLKKIAQIYTQVEQKISSFKRKSIYTCPADCGSCCLNFEPDILEEEALFLAVYLLANKRQQEFQLINFSSSNSSCIFYDAKAQLHCSVYPARPLICRLFGFSGVYDKKAELVYKPCAEMVKIKSKINRLVITNKPPSMIDFGLQLQSLAKSGKRELMRLALVKAFHKIRLYQKLLSLTKPEIELEGQAS